VPSGDVERKTITYVYEHFGLDWSVDDDHAMRDFAFDQMSRNGAKILQSKGHVPLRDNQQFSLLYQDDDKLHVQREKWITEKLKKIIASGRADSQEEAEKTKAKKEDAGLDGTYKVGSYRNPLRFMLPIE